MERIESIDDPRIAAYRDLKNRTLRGQRLFITEGPLLTRRLLESPFGVESVLVGAMHAEQFRRLVGEAAPLYVAPDRMLGEIVGFKFHRGVLACGRRPKPLTLDDLPPPAGAEQTLLVCPAVCDRENFGSLCRIAAAFGLDGVLLGERCCDPFCRRVLRVSMGAVFRLPIVRSADLADDLRTLKARRGTELWAAVLDEDAQPLHRVRRPPALAVLFGHETHGLSEPWLAMCDRRVTIPMRRGIDSLNLAVAAGIFFYVLTRRPGASPGSPEGSGR